MKRVVTIAGAGALGSHALLLLRNEDAHFRVVDFDRVESKNTLSQAHGRTSVGLNKADALKRSFSLLYPKVQVAAFPRRIVVDNAATLLGGSDLVLDCLDNAESRYLVQRVCFAKEIPCLHGALAPDGQFGRVVWSEKFDIDDEPATGAATCEDGAHMPMIASVAASMARAAQVFLRTGKRVGFEVNPFGSTRT